MTSKDPPSLPTEAEKLSSKIAALEREQELISAQFADATQRLGFFVTSSRHPVGEGVFLSTLIVVASVLVIWIARPSTPALVAIGVTATLLLALAVRHIIRGIRYFWMQQIHSWKMRSLYLKIISLKRQRKKHQTRLRQGP